MTFKEQFAAIFAATDGKNHLALQRFLLAAADDQQRYSQPVRNLFLHIAAGLRDFNIAPVCLADIGPTDISALKFATDHLRRCDILPLAALGSCLFSLVFEAETALKLLDRQLKMLETGAESGDYEWTGQEFYDTIIAEEARLAALKRSQAASDEGKPTDDDTPNDEKPDGL